MDRGKRALSPGSRRAGSSQSAQALTPRASTSGSGGRLNDYRARGLHGVFEALPSLPSPEPGTEQRSRGGCDPAASVRLHARCAHAPRWPQADSERGRGSRSRQGSWFTAPAESLTSVNGSIALGLTSGRLDGGSDGSNSGRGKK